MYLYIFKSKCIGEFNIYIYIYKNLKMPNSLDCKSGSASKSQDSKPWGAKNDCVDKGLPMCLYERPSPRVFYSVYILRPSSIPIFMS